MQSLPTSRHSRRFERIAYCLQTIPDVAARLQSQAQISNILPQSSQRARRSDIEICIGYLCVLCNLCGESGCFACESFCLARRRGLYRACLITRQMKRSGLRRLPHRAAGRTVRYCPVDYGKRIENRHCSPPRTIDANTFTSTVRPVACSNSSFSQPREQLQYASGTSSGGVPWI